MKKIRSIKEIIIYTLLIVVFGLLQLNLLINLGDNITIVIIVYACIVVVVLSLLKLFAIPYHIVVNGNRVKVYDFPLFATKKFYDKKRSLILWNSQIDLYEVEEVELVKLTKDEKLKYVGFNHLFNEYIKVNLRNCKSHKYIYASIYSKSQVNKIMHLLINE